MPEDLVGKNFNNFLTEEVTFEVGRDQQGKLIYQQSNRAKALAFAKECAETRRNFLLVGRPGSGKSHLAAGAFYTAWEAGLTGYFLTFNRLGDKLKATYNNSAEVSYEAVLEQHRQAQVLVIDDLGTQRPSENDLKIVKDVIDYRIGNPKLWTILTTNLSGPQITDWFGEKLKSRLGKHYFSRFVVEAPDYRNEDW